MHHWGRMTLWIHIIFGCVQFMYHLQHELFCAARSTYITNFTRVGVARSHIETWCHKSSHRKQHNGSYNCYVASVCKNDRSPTVQDAANCQDKAQGQNPRATWTWTQIRRRPSLATQQHSSLQKGITSNWDYQLWLVQRRSIAMVIATATVNLLDGWFN